MFMSVYLYARILCLYGVPYRRLALALYVCRYTYGVDFGCCFKSKGNAKASRCGTAICKFHAFFVSISIHSSMKFEDFKR